MNSELKVLLLEDNPADAEIIQRLLLKAGLQFQAIVASDEKEFLETLAENRFDVVLADNAIPQYNSLEALKVIKERNPFIAFILVTGTVSEEFAVSIIQQGADDYILKTNLTRLPSAIQKAVENKTIQREKQSAEIEMRELNEQLHRLAAHLQNIREDEQVRIAREIHDELGQMLTSLKMDISLSERKMEQSLPEAKEFLRKAMEVADDLVTAIRRIASELRPAILDDLGLLAALEWQSQEFEKHNNNVKCVFHSDLQELEVDKEITTGLYRIYQEALTNILRHAAATKITASIRRSGERLILMITDNGKGFSPESVKAKKSLGLVGMKERAFMMKGDLDISSKPGEGTTITISILQSPQDTPHKGQH